MFPYRIVMHQDLFHTSTYLLHDYKMEALKDNVFVM